MEYDLIDSLEGVIESIIFRNEENGYTVFAIRCDEEEVTCVGAFDMISEGEYIAAKGMFVKHPLYDMQFSVKSYEFKAPQDRLSVLRYLSSGAIKGIGEKLAASIIAKFGDDTFRIIEEEPERLAEIKGISMNKAMDISNQIVEKRDMRKAMIYLQSFGITMKLANKIYSKYGQKIYTVLQENPYKLADDIEGVGFKIADDIAQRAGISINSEYRIKSAIYYTLCQAVGQGHVYLPQNELEAGVRELLLIDITDFDKYIADLVMEKKVVVKLEDAATNIYAAQYYFMELGVARMLYDLEIAYECDKAAMDNRISDIERDLDITLDDIQMEAVRTAVLNGLMILTGGPGTGKTTTINAIIRFFQLEGLDIRLAAPTGRAAKRMSEATGYEAQTIHRMLEICGGVEDGTGSSSHFDRNADNPLETDVIIVDEMSMVDISIMNALLKAVAVGTRLILVGDVDQLPSVGAGNVLKDIIKSEVFPVVKLEKIFRQAAESEIITNAHKINRGEEIVLNKYSKDFLFVRRNTPEEIIGAMRTLISSKLPDYVGAEVNEIQILTPSRKSSVGVERLNQVMQEFLNPPEYSKNEHKHGETLFREGDKVMQIKNNYQLTWERRNSKNIVYDMGTGVFNGDSGVIAEINDHAAYVKVRFEDGRYVNYEYPQLDELELAYAITVHKSQGSEYPAVLIPMFNGPRLLMNKNLLYTAVTRARKCVCMVGVEDIFHQMAANESEQRRYSSLDRRLRQIHVD